MATDQQTVTVLNKTAQYLIQKMHQEYQNGYFPDDLLLSLHSTFGNTFERAIELADATVLYIFEAESGQKLWKVKTSLDDWVYLFPHINFCKCDSFKYQVLKKGNALTCKHRLAAEINFSRKKYENQVISTKNMTALLHDICVQKILHAPVGQED